MKKRKKREIGKCVYCHQVRLLTNDHVPPKNLFPKPRPTNLITVPSCSPCNEGFKLDDEYFRQVIRLGVDPNDFPIVVEVIHKLGVNQKIGIAKYMLSNLNPRDGSVNLDRSRVERVMERVIRGLYFHHVQQTLSPATELRIWFTCFGDALPIDIELANLLDHLNSQRLYRIGNGIVSYRCILDSDEAESSAWHFCFYQKNEVVGVTVPGRQAL